MKPAQIAYIPNLNLFFCTEEGKEEVYIFKYVEKFTRIMCAELYAEQKGEMLHVRYRRDDNPSVELTHLGPTTIIWEK